MSNLLTTKEVQNLLKVDRTTIYRMLKDGRLKGVKVGQQWRFPIEEMEALLSGGTRETTEATSSIQVLPLHCIEPIQRVFAEIAGLGAVTTDAEGNPLTEISNSCAFCNLVIGSESGRKACIASWRRLAQQDEYRTQFMGCHAGLQYARARIEIDGEFVAMLITGQFYASSPDSDEEAARVQHLAIKHGIDEDALAEAIQEIRVLDERMCSQIGNWLEQVAHTFEDIGHERAELLQRLQSIAQMSTLPSDIPSSLS
jgi:excisionase family DNA binding protein